MANVDAPNGFTPLRHLTGGVIRANEYAIANGYAANLASGDIVALHTDGTIIRGTAGGVVLGVFYGVEYIENDTGDVKFRKVWNNATTAKSNDPIKAYVYDDPNITYKIQCNGTYGHSTDELAISTLGVTAQSLRILRLIDYPKNAVGADADVEVVINLSLFGTRQAGI